MSDSSDMRAFSLTKPATPESLQALRAAVMLAAASTPAAQIAIDVDDVGVLDTPIISALISMLRDVRARGGSISLRASRAKILDTLRITALDKVFNVVAAPASPELAAAAPAVSLAKPRAPRVAAVAGVALLAASLLGVRASTSAEPAAPVDLVRSVIAQNAAVASYRAHVAVDVHLHSFPYISQHLDGTTYYKRPGNYEVVFEKVPSYAKGFDKLYADIDDPSSWDRRFEMSLVGDRDVDGHRDVVIRLVQKVRGMIDHQDVAIDPSRAHIDAMEWHYYNGGEIAMTQQYQQVAGVDVLASQHATIRIPFVHAGADAAYTGYETNVAIDDAVFTHEAHK